MSRPLNLFIVVAALASLAGCHLIANELPCDDDAQCPGEFPVCANSVCVAAGEEGEGDVVGEGEGDVGEGEGDVGEGEGDAGEGEGDAGEGEGDVVGEGEGEGEGEGDIGLGLSPSVHALSASRSFMATSTLAGENCDAGAVGALGSTCRRGLNVFTDAIPQQCCNEVRAGLASGTDENGWFEWRCIDRPTGGPVMMADHFRPGVTLRDLIRDDATAFKTNVAHVTGCSTGDRSTARGTWWENAFALPQATLDAPDTIYADVVNARPFDNHVSVTAARVALAFDVVDGIDAVTPGLEGVWIASRVTGGRVGTGIALNCTFCSVAGSRVDGFATGIQLKGKASLVEDTSVVGANNHGVIVNDSDQLLRRVVITRSQHSGLRIESAARTWVDDVVVTGNGLAGAGDIEAVFVGGTGNDTVMTRLLVVNNQGSGIIITGPRATLIASTSGLNGGTGLGLEGASVDDAFVSQVLTVANSGELHLRAAATANIVDSAFIAVDAEPAVTAEDAGTSAILVDVAITGSCVGDRLDDVNLDEFCNRVDGGVPAIDHTIDADAIIDGAVTGATDPDTARAGPIATLSDFDRFDNRFRTFAEEGAIIVDGGGRGACLGSCHVVDWRSLKPSPLVEQFTIGANLVDIHGNAITAVPHAIEVDGNGNGYCDVDGEVCFELPNIGAYQGEGAIFGTTGGGSFADTKFEHFQENGISGG